MTESAIIFATVRPTVDTTSSSEHLSKALGDAKEVIILGGKYHKVGDPSISQAVVVQPPLFFRDYFCLESPT